MMGYENFFYVQDGGMKFSIMVRDYPLPWYPGLKMTAPLRRYENFASQKYSPLDQGIRKILEKGLHGNENSKLDSGL